MSAWISVIAALAGAAIGGIISYVATLTALTRQENSERRNIILSRLEETHQVARSIRKAYKDIFGHIYMHHTVGLEMPDRDAFPIELDRLAMLVDFYFPELKSSTEVLESAGDRFGDVLVELIASGRSETDKMKLLDDFTQKYEELDNACGTLLDAIAIAARKRIGI